MLLRRNPQYLKSLSSLLNLNHKPNDSNCTLYPLIKLTLHLPNLRIQPKASIFDTYSPNSCSWSFGFLDYGSRQWMSRSNRPSMRSKVERRMQRESGKTLREICHAQKLKKKIMTKEERLIYNIRRVFSHMFSLQLEEDVNEVLFALKSDTLFEENISSNDQAREAVQT